MKYILIMMLALGCQKEIGYHKPPKEKPPKEETPEEPKLLLREFGTFFTPGLLYSTPDGVIHDFAKEGYTAYAIADGTIIMEYQGVKYVLIDYVLNEYFTLQTGTTTIKFTLINHI